MALLAARRDDLQACPTHGPAQLLDGLPSVRTNGRPAARVGDAFSCGGCQNRVKTGASTVTIGGEMAARLTDASDHGGTVILGSANVVIGGPAGIGCIGAGKGNCQAMAAGRKSGSTAQSYGNCVLESVRQIVRRATGNEVTEEELLQHALDRRLCHQGDQQHLGGSDGESGKSILNNFGIPAERMPAGGPPSLTAIKQAISERRGVVAFVDPHEFSPDLYPEPANHAIVVTGVEMDKNGNVIAVYINDTGAGECGKKVPAERFGAALQNLPAAKAQGGAPLLVTQGGIW